MKDLTKHSLCWDCANAFGGCPWSKKFVPVENWVAIPTKLWHLDHYTDSFLVEDCPLFVKQLVIPGYCQVTANTIATLLDESAQYVNHKNDEYLKLRLNLLGFDLKIQSFNNRRYYYISKKNKK